MQSIRHQFRGPYPTGPEALTPPTDRGPFRCYRAAGDDRCRPADVGDGLASVPTLQTGDRLFILTGARGEHGQAFGPARNSSRDPDQFSRRQFLQAGGAGLIAAKAAGVTPVIRLFHAERIRDRRDASRERKPWTLRELPKPATPSTRAVRC